MILVKVLRTMMELQEDRREWDVHRNQRLRCWSCLERGQILNSFSQNWRQVVIYISIKLNRSSRNMSMSMSMTVILTSTWRGQILNGFSQNWRQIVILNSTGLAGI